jgi:L-lysine exporter family protein LysE/ArgO
MSNLFLEGLLLQASLIFALGAQNFFILESGLKNQYPLLASVFCFLCDLLLIMLGVAGAGTFFSSNNFFKIFVGALGSLFLFIYGFQKVMSPKQINSCSNKTFDTKVSIKRTIFLALTFSLLNPHAYLDAFILIGGYSSKYLFLEERLFLGFGAAAFSLLWFLLLSGASQLMKPIFTNEKKLKIISTCAGLTLILLSFRLGSDVYQWASHDLSKYFHPEIVHVSILSHSH